MTKEVAKNKKKKNDMKAKFRGKIACDDLKKLENANVEIPHNNGWVVGNFIAPNLIVGDVVGIYWDYFSTEWWVRVIPETIGLFTGLKDKNGIEIYEGDIFHLGEKRILYTVVWHDTGLRGGQNGTLSFVGLNHWQDRIEIIGNISDNPELIEKI